MESLVPGATAPLSALARVAEAWLDAGGGGVFDRGAAGFVGPSPVGLAGEWGFRALESGMRRVVSAEARPLRPEVVSTVLVLAPWLDRLTFSRPQPTSATATTSVGISQTRWVWITGDDIGISPRGIEVVASRSGVDGCWQL
jgi:hypothetical protein